jgi:hypothetical protein
MHPNRNHLRAIVWLCGLLLVSACQPATPSAPPPITDCVPAPQGQVLADGWRFQIEPVATAQGWQDPTLDDSAWRTDIQAGRAWDFQGLADFDGVAWFRQRITLSDGPAYLGISSVDDSGTLWVDGIEAATFTNASHQLTVVDLRQFAPSANAVTLALRIDDQGLYGGVKSPIMLGTTARAVMTAGQYVETLAADHPTWVLPSWSRGRPLAWTMTGQPNADDETLVSMDGAIAAWANAPVARAWLYDPASQTHFSGEGAVTFTLHQEHLPIPVWRWQAGNSTVEQTLFQARTADSAIRWRVQVNADRPLQLIVAALPFAVNRTANPIYQAVVTDQRHIWLNNAPFLSADLAAAHSGNGTVVNVMEAAARGNVPNNLQLPCAPEGDGAAVLVYDLNTGPQTFTFTLAPRDADTFSPAADFDTALTATSDAWAADIAQVRLQLPDDRLAAAWRASVGYLLLAMDSDGVHPGPLAHSALWVRDAAYIGLALMQSGHTEHIPTLISGVYAGQDQDGRVPPIQGETIPWDDDEWDSQGQAIFLVTQYYRYTQEIETLRQWYPNLRRASEFIRALRTQTANATDATRGLLPPSLSAEDLGPADHHYYWDNYWAIIGLEEVAFAADLLGENADAIWMRAEAAHLRQAIARSINMVMGDAPAYIPVAVEDTQTSGMARGTVPTLYPYALYPFDDPLLLRSFDYYHQTWIDPYGGGFLHREGQFWPYGGLELAHAYLRLQRGDVVHQILGWTLSNQTLMGTYAWAEQVNPQDKGFTGGDMPHAWAAADYLTLIREMIVSERATRISLFNSVPEWWFDADRVIVLENAPTHFGTITVRTSSTLQQVDGAWHGIVTLELIGATPPDGFLWQLSRIPSRVDGPAQLQGDQLTIAPNGGTITLIYE